MLVFIQLMQKVLVHCQLQNDLVFHLLLKEDAVVECVDNVITIVIVFSIRRFFVEYLIRICY
jgi:hypothetical protein